MNKLLASAADTGVSLNGDWREFSLDAENVFRVKLAPSGSINPAFVKKAQETMRKYGKAGVALEDLPVAQQATLNSRIYSGTVLLDWNSEDFGQGFSLEAAENTMRESSQFRDFVISESGRVNSFRAAAVAATSGN